MLRPPQSLTSIAFACCRNPNLAQRLGRLDLHFHKLCFFRFSQSLLPGKHLRRRHPAFFAKCRHALTTRDLLGQDRTPLLSKTRAMFCHEFRVPHARALNKMAFKYRSRIVLYGTPSASIRISRARNTYPAGSERDWAMLLNSILCPSFNTTSFGCMTT